MKAEDDHSPAVGDKLRFKEADWGNLREQCAAAGIPNNVIAVLNERQARVLAGESEILDWDQVKVKLGRG